MSNLTLNQVAKESIIEALLRLMKIKDFEKIKVKEITDLAGVGRVSFYRNFDSKQDVVIQHLSSITKEWVKTQPGQFREVKDYLPLLLVLRPTLEVLKSSNSTYLLHQYFYQALLPEVVNTKNGYFFEMRAGMFSGIIYHWMRNDFKESLTELNDYVGYLNLIDFKEM